MKTVSLTTGARLHFGPLSVEAPAGGRFGGVGVMIDSPRIELSACLADSDRVDSDEKTSARVLEFLRRIRLADPSIPTCAIRVTRTIPSHCGFGSGTQLGLAIARAVGLLAGETEIGLETLARRVGRGLRSAIGLYGHLEGGFLVDGGRVEAGQIGTLVSRVDFPAQWRFVLAAPRQTIGLSGEAEQSAFASQPSMPMSLTSELCRIVLMDWLPAVIRSDFARTSEAMYLFGQRVGEFFAPAQGGVFANARMSAWATELRRRGLDGIAQTSWGPTIAALCASDHAAQQLVREFSTDSQWSDCTFEIACPLNHGACARLS